MKQVLEIARLGSGLSDCQSGRPLSISGCITTSGCIDVRRRETAVAIDPHSRTPRPLRVVADVTGVHIDSTPTVGALLERFIAHVRQLALAGQLKPRTLSAYETLALPPSARPRKSEARRDEARRGASIDVFASSLRAEDVEQWLLRVAAEIVERGLSLPTVTRGRRRGQVRKPRNGATTANRALVVLGLAIRLAAVNDFAGALGLGRMQIARAA